MSPRHVPSLWVISDIYRHSSGDLCVLCLISLNFAGQKSTSIFYKAFKKDAINASALNLFTGHFVEFKLGFSDPQ